MRSGARTQGTRLVSTFEERDEAALTAFLGELLESEGDLAIRLRVELQVAAWVRRGIACARVSRPRSG